MLPPSTDISLGTLGPQMSKSTMPTWPGKTMLMREQTCDSAKLWTDVRLVWLHHCTWPTSTCTVLVLFPDQVFSCMPCKLIKKKTGSGHFHWENWSLSINCISMSHQSDGVNSSQIASLQIFGCQGLCITDIHSHWPAYVKKSAWWGHRSVQKIWSGNSSPGHCSETTQPASLQELYTGTGT